MKLVTMFADFADGRFNLPTKYVTKFIDIPITHILSDSSVPTFKKRKKNHSKKNPLIQPLKLCGVKFLNLWVSPKMSPAASHPPVFDLSAGLPRKSTATLSSAFFFPSPLETKTCKIEFARKDTKPLIIVQTLNNQTHTWRWSYHFFFSLFVVGMNKDTVKVFVWLWCLRNRRRIEMQRR